MRGSRRLLLLPLLVACGCRESAQPAPRPTNGTASSTSASATATATAPTNARPSLADARRGFSTKLPSTDDAERSPAPEPPAPSFALVRYSAPAGNLAAYLTPDPGDGLKHPAIVWITGGDCNSIGEVWQDAPRKNDQTAAAYRKAGIVMMFPSLRGGNDNPGRREGFYGEVDDVLAAADFLARRPYVDPRRIYLGGHSTGGTLVMLVAESSDRFRAAFSFGPVDDPSAYPSALAPFDRSDSKEVALRAPIRWLDSVRSPLFVIEGAAERGNVGALRAMAKATSNPAIRFLPIAGYDHFSVLAPANELIAKKILGDTGQTTQIAMAASELDATQR